MRGRGYVMQHFGKLQNLCFRAVVLLLVVPWLAIKAAPCLAIDPNQLDDFEDGTTQNWSVGFDGDPVPSNVADPAPSHANDRALFMANTGAGGSRPNLLVINGTLSRDSTWAGDWTGAGLTHVSMDVRNPNLFELKMRLGITGPLSLGIGNRYITDAISVPADNAWHSIAFDVLPADFIALNEDDEIEEALANVTHLRILNNADESFFGSGVAGTFYLDNIRALAAVQAVAGDYNRDLAVDAADYVVWRDQRSQSISPGTGADGTGPAGVPDGVVDGLDYDFWRARFGNAAGASSSLAAVVPEPASWLAMTMLFVIAWNLVRRRV